MLPESKMEAPSSSYMRQGSKLGVTAVQPEAEVEE
jgi:hypothetical protein